MFYVCVLLLFGNDDRNSNRLVRHTQILKQDCRNRMGGIGEARASQASAAATAAVVVLVLIVRR